MLVLVAIELCDPSKAQVGPFSIIDKEGKFSIIDQEGRELTNHAAADFLG